MNSKRVTRLLRLLQMLQARSGDNVDGLAAAAEVSRRTVFRDIKTLREAGVPVEFDHETQKYSLPLGYLLPPTNFTPEESLALIGLTAERGRGDALPFFEPARRAALKLQATLPPALRSQVEQLTRHVKIRSPQLNRLADKQDVYQLLIDARASQRQVWIAYDSLTEWERIETTIRPYHLTFINRSWYLIGRSSLHREVRIFNVGRIVELRVLDETFKTPRGFNLKRYFGNAWRMIREPGPDHKVHLRFTQFVATNVSEVHWHPTQRIEQREDGSIDFYATVSGISEISWWVLQYGDQVEVIAPAKLRRLVAKRIEGMARIYRPADEDR
ncbi:MAG: WYL domain-containing protein [Planctomycetota bacterium]